MATDIHERRKKLLATSMRRVAALGPGETLWTTQTAIWIQTTRDEAEKLLNELARRGLIEPDGDRWRTTAR